MGILLLLLLVALAGAVVVAAAIENTDAATVTIAGQTLGGLSLGGWLAAFAVLGFLAAYLLLGALAAGRRARSRRKALRSSEREMAERVAALERENRSLRDGSEASHDGVPAGDAVARDDAAADRGGHGDHVDQPVERDSHGRRLHPPEAAHAAVPDRGRDHDHAAARRDDRDQG